MSKSKHSKNETNNGKSRVKKRSSVTNKNKTQIEKNNSKELRKTKKDLKKTKKSKFKEKHPVAMWIIRIIVLLILIIAVVVSGIIAGYMFGAFGDDFEISEQDLILENLNSNSVIVDSQGNTIAELSGDENRKIILLDEMSPYLVNAYVSIEDERFYEHNGVDLYRTAGAIANYVVHAGKSSFGGSTITQQLVKNITGDKEDSGIEGMLRKVKEWAKAYQVERILSKQQILELYLNLIFVGGDNYGVQTAANYYFNKSASDLSLLECAFLAGINNSPNAYNPYGDYAYGTNENKTNKINTKTKVVLNKMLELGKITNDEYNETVQELETKGITFTKGTTATTYSYHTDALINQVIKEIAEQKNISKELAEIYLYTSGLTIYSTEVESMQQQTQEAMDNAVILTSKNTKDESGNYVKSQAAIVVIDHKTGYVVSCVGGLGEKTSRGLNRATQSVRQPGSTIKPIADVAPAIEEKIITAATIYNDNYTVFPGTTPYTPKNYNGYRGLITVRDAIETSQNIPFVKIMSELGVEKSMQYLEKMGVRTLEHEKEGLALAIGGITNGISPLEMAAAYATIANDGVYIEPTFYTKVVDSNGNVVLTSNQKTERVFSESTASLMKNILKQPVVGTSGTAKACKISGIDVAAKTGTTNGDKDRWLCGFTNYYTAAVWYGFDEPEQIIVSGISPATRIWAQAMKGIHSGLSNSTFTMSSNIVSAKICKTTGMLATDTCTDTYTEYFIKGTVPQSCEGHKGYVVCNESHELANEYCTSTSTIYKTYLVEKEKSGKWKTDANNVENEIPTTYCTIHKAPEIEKPKEPEKPSNSTTENTTGGNTIGNDVSSNNTTGNNVEGNNTIGNNVESNNTAGNNVEGNNTTGNDLEGNNVIENSADGNNVSGNETIENNTTENKKTD